MNVVFPSHATPGDQMQLPINLGSQLVQTPSSPRCHAWSSWVISCPRASSIQIPRPGGVANCVNITTPPGRYPKKFLSHLQVYAAIFAIWLPTGNWFLRLLTATGSPRWEYKALKIRTPRRSRPRPRVRVPSTPPFQIKHLQKWRHPGVGTKRYQRGTSLNGVNSGLVRPPETPNTRSALPQFDRHACISPLPATDELLGLPVQIC